MAEKIIIELSEDDFIALVHGCAQSSCAYNRNHVVENLWHLHCCDYNDLIRKVVSQVGLTHFDDTDNVEYLKKILNEINKDEKSVEE